MALLTAVVLATSAVTAAENEPAQQPIVKTPDIIRLLHHRGWRDGTFGPTGQRLFTERLEHGLGIRGQFSYIHHAKIMDPIRLTLLHDGREAALTEESVDWAPSHLQVRYAAGGLAVIEQKFITDDDVWVVMLTLTNRSGEPFNGEIVCTSGIATQRGGPGAAADNLIGSGVFAGVEAWVAACGAEFTLSAEGDRLTRRVQVQTGRHIQVRVAAGMAEQVGVAHERALAWLQRPDPLVDHARQYQQWFDENCPVFECDDPFLVKCWWYRMFVMRHCLSRSQTGNLPHAYFFEGAHEGHFPRLIAFSSPHIIAEARWLRNGDYAWGQVLNHVRNPDDKHRYFISARVDEKGGDYNNWITAAAWDLYTVHPRKDRLKAAVPAMAADVRGTMEFYDADRDFLPVPRNHWTTGMEFQPAFFFFNDYDNTKPDARLERPDFAAYVYANARAVASACLELGQQEEGRLFVELADRIRQATLAKLWDDQDGFFYAVRENDDAMARVREVVGFYPFAFGLVPDEPRYTGALKYLVDPAEFWTTFPPTTVSKKCPAYTPKPEHWPAAGGRTHGCMWNGPTWPHATSVAINAAGAAVREYRQDKIKADDFWEMLERYTRLHFTQGELRKPLLREYNHGETGEATGCPDYFHSTYCDLIVRHVVGLEPGNDEWVRVRPIPGRLKRFALRGVLYRDRLIDIVYNSEPAGPQGEPAGLTIRVDGRPMAHRDDLGPLAVDLGAETGSP
ncbi:MAG TPA: hypothetical protein VLM89_00935 [Phycisphaerae bacterium]|nr:hypothetical protein [Phycisphaerae bacterium]